MRREVKQLPNPIIHVAQSQVNHEPDQNEEVAQHEAPQQDLREFIE
jgi:hypothetical protein